MMTRRGQLNSLQDLREDISIIENSAKYHYKCFGPGSIIAFHLILQAIHFLSLPVGFEAPNGLLPAKLAARPPTRLELLFTPFTA